PRQGEFAGRPVRTHLELSVVQEVRGMRGAARPLGYCEWEGHSIDLFRQQISRKCFASLLDDRSEQAVQDRIIPSPEKIEALVGDPIVFLRTSSRPSNELLPDEPHLDQPFEMLARRTHLDPEPRCDRLGRASFLSER